ncbi:NAD(P)-dependent oxidoreductase [Staphylococcus cohnii]|uniref:Adenosylhomocysteinase n=1 Tax=Staphylococcus cohnii subsp. cohnii TaxID=74704 RepID=A0A0M2NSJ2_STACC|nr:NAD(P)-dependent oxidoreductase [Staphylococcus cohnii]KKI62977.1 Adenosylhomocysteinase [Staphylococcus cohnii subsp. cohnii]
MMKPNYLLKEKFFEKIFSPHHYKNKQKIIIVEHCVTNTLDFIKFLSRYYEVYFIPKPNSIDKDIMNILEDYVTFLFINKEQLKSKKELINLIEEYVGKSKFYIIDIGGYFSWNYKVINEYYSNQILSIIENTENGLQKYEKEIKNLKENNLVQNVPVCTVARSILKIEEDFLVGNEVAIKSEVFLSEFGTNLIGKKVLVIGFGKIGSSLSQSLKHRGAIVYVLDKQAVRQAFAISQGYLYDDFDNLLNNLDIIYIANGEKSIDIDSLDRKCSGKLYIFSVTSVDDTFSNVEYLKNALEIEGQVPYYSLNTKLEGSIIVANKGNAINFTYTNSTLASFVQMTQGEMLLLLNDKVKTITNSGITELKKADQESIAKIWLEEYIAIENIGGKIE